MSQRFVAAGVKGKDLLADYSSWARACPRVSPVGMSTGNIDSKLCGCGVETSGIPTGQLTLEAHCNHISTRISLAGQSNWQHSCSELGCWRGSTDSQLGKEDPAMRRRAELICFLPCLHAHEMRRLGG